MPYEENARVSGDDIMVIVGSAMTVGTLPVREGVTGQGSHVSFIEQLERIARGRSGSQGRLAVGGSSMALLDPIDLMTEPKRRWYTSPLLARVAFAACAVAAIIVFS
ncbi:MAG TPA: hypothetical protein VGB83_08785 [Actinomycetota bacterium]